VKIFSFQAFCSPLARECQPGRGNPPALGQRRQRQRKNIKRLKDRAKAFCFTIFQVAMRGNHHRTFTLIGLSRRPRSTLLLRARAALCLHRHGHVADFVQEKCSRRRLFEFAQMSDAAPVKPFFMSEKFRFNQFPGRPRSSGDKGVLLPRRFFMDGAPRPIPCPAGLTENADRRLARRHRSICVHNSYRRPEPPILFPPGDGAAPVFVFEPHNRSGFPRHRGSFSVETASPENQACPARALTAISIFACRNEHDRRFDAGLLQILSNSKRSCRHTTSEIIT